MRQLEHRGDRLHRLLRRHAQPLEPHVDLHEHVAGAGRRSRVRACAVEIHQRRHEPVRDRRRRGLGQRIRIHEDRGRDAPLPQANALGEVGDGQRVGAVRDEHAPHLRGAVAVAVRLHDGEDLPRGSHHLAHGADVRRGGIQVDLERGGPGRAGRWRGGHGGSSTGMILTGSTSR
jgi:hypothetical protein